MTARQLRLHLTAAHDIPTRGLTHDHMTALHDYEHRAGVDQDHDHQEGRTDG